MFSNKKNSKKSNSLVLLKFRVQLRNNYKNNI